MIHPADVVLHDSGVGSFICKPHENLHLFIDRSGLGQKQQLLEKQTTAHPNGEAATEKEQWQGPRPKRLTVACPAGPLCPSRFS